MAIVSKFETSQSKFEIVRVKLGLILFNSMSVNIQPYTKTCKNVKDKMRIALQENLSKET